MRRFSYVSIDGVLSHLGFSQVFRVLEGLAQRGLPSSLVTLESESDLSNKERVEWLRARALTAGIDWTWHPYKTGGSARAAVRNLAALSALATRAATRERPTHFHARGYQAAGIVLGLQAAWKCPWIFDPRGFWIDERLEEDRWFTKPSVLRVARSLERKMYESADAVVTLTALHASDLIEYGLRPATRPAVVIPTCADFHDFNPRQKADLQLVPSEVRTKLKGGPVYGIIGSVNRAYLPEQTAALAARCLELDPRAQLLVLTKQSDAWMQALERAGIAPERATCLTVPHNEMPRWLGLMTWCLMLLTPETRAKRAAMPTKLAELFASNVQIAFHGCNSEATDWVRKAGAGIVLDGTDDASLDDAAKAMCARTGDRVVSRLATEQHFSLESGLERYQSTIRTLSRLPRPRHPA